MTIKIDAVLGWLDEAEARPEQPKEAPPLDRNRAAILLQAAHTKRIIFFRYHSAASRATAAAEEEGREEADAKITPEPEEGEEKEEATEWYSDHLLTGIESEANALWPFSVGSLTPMSFIRRGWGLGQPFGDFFTKFEPI